MALACLWFGRATVCGAQKQQERAMHEQLKLEQQTKALDLQFASAVQQYKDGGARSLLSRTALRCQLRLFRSVR